MSGQQMGLVIIASGVVLLVVGLILSTGGFSWFGHLPGDLRIQRGSTQLFIPITSMILVSVVLTIVLRVAGLLLRRFF